MREPKRHAIAVRIAPENLSEIRAKAAAAGQSVTWYVLDKLGLHPETSEGRQAEVTKPFTGIETENTKSNRLPVQLTAEEMKVFKSLVSTSGKSQSAFVHMRLGIEPRERGHPGHRRWPYPSQWH